MEAADRCDELLRLSGLTREPLPDLQPPGSVVGEFTSEAAEACGLPAGLPVVGGAGDGQSAGLGETLTQGWHADRLVPYWDGSKTPCWDGSKTPCRNPDARGVLFGLADHHGKGHIYRAILEGMAFEQRLQLDWLDEALPRPVQPRTRWVGDHAARCGARSSGMSAGGRPWPRTRADSDRARPPRS